MAVVWDNNWQFVWNGCGLGQQLAVCVEWLWVGTTTGSLCGMAVVWDNNWQFVWNGCGLGQQIEVSCGMIIMVVIASLLATENL
jgi:hypothetical protein